VAILLDACVHDRRVLEGRSPSPRTRKATMPNLILTTMGTSLLTNQAPQDIGKLLRETSNTREDALTPEDRRRLEGHAEAQRQRLQAGGVEDARRWSAELNGLAAFYGGVLRPGHGRPDHNLLVATDTWQGRRAAEIVRSWLEEKGFSVESPLIPSRLQTSSLADFRTALAWLAGDLNGRIQDYRRKGYRIVFNLTGGFKSVNGFLQTLGTLWADEIFYLFEGGTEPMRIPRLPLHFEPEAIIERDLRAWRRLAIFHERPAGDDFPTIMMFEVDDGAMLSEWGELIWQSGSNAIYERALLDPPSEQVHYGPRLASDIRRLGLTNEQLRLLNAQIDELSRCIESEGQHNPDSLSFKRLRGDPVPGSTHEAYAWSGRGGYRLFGHHEDRIFVIDHLDKHL
jgi:putative CRISPR-associated protein (TIGR02619 family)